MVDRRSREVPTAQATTWDAAGRCFQCDDTGRFVRRVHATTSADRSNSGISASVACACTRSRSATPNRSARPRSLRASRSDCWSPRSASPMITNSAAGISRKARTNASKPLSGNIFPTPTTRCSPLRAACGPFGVNALPHVRLAESAGAQNVRATAVRNLDSPDSHSG